MKRGSTSSAIREMQIQTTQLDTRLKTTPQIYKKKKKSVGWIATHLDQLTIEASDQREKGLPLTSRWKTKPETDPQHCTPFIRRAYEFQW